jgi:hypothetical protein
MNSAHASVVASSYDKGTLPLGALWTLVSPDYEGRSADPQRGFEFQNEPNYTG